MTTICDNCHIEWDDEREETRHVVRHRKDCVSCTNGYEMPDREPEDLNETPT